MPTAAEAPVLTIEKQGHVLMMGLNRPQKRNAFNLELIRALSSAYTELGRDDSLRVGLLFAHGDHFTAGLDLAEVGPVLAQGQSLFEEGVIDPWGVQGEPLPKPIVIAVQGTCLTAGVELALNSEVCVAATNASFAQLEVQRGIMPIAGATFRFPRLTGWGNAMRYLLTGDRFTADEAYRIGLVQELVEPGRHVDRALEIATSIAEQAPLAVRATLANARKALAAGPAAAAADLPKLIRHLSSTADAAEGLMSFVERRKAMFHGR